MASYDKSKDKEYTLAVQRALKTLGADLGAGGVDGKWGEYTESAYQANKDAVDKLIGGGSTGGSAGFGSSATDTLKGFESSGSRPTYNVSPELQSIRDQLAAFEGNKPADFQSKYQAQIDGLLDKIMNREPFQYNFDADPLYQQYKDRYTQQGKMAMQDTMAQAAALTGGYGNSFAQQVGQQTYNANMQALNDVIPELYGQAYQMYRDQGNDLRNNLGTYMDLDSVDYSRYRDDVGDYYTELNYLYNKSNDMSDREYQMYLNDADAWEADRAYWLNKAQMEQDQANWEAEFALAQQKASSSGGSSGGGRSSGGSSKGDADEDAPDKTYNIQSTNKDGSLLNIYVPGYGNMSAANFASEYSKGNIGYGTDDYGRPIYVKK